jgi:hypothetical protein
VEALAGVSGGEGRTEAAPEENLVNHCECGDRVCRDLCLLRRRCCNWSDAVS